MSWHSSSQSRATMTIGVELLLLVGCWDDLPNAPPELTAGIVVYERTGYRGESAHITTDVSDLSDFRGPCEHTIFNGEEDEVYYDWEDCISSVRVAPGWRATLYRDSGYERDSVNLISDLPDLKLVPGECSQGGFSHCVSSIRVEEQ